MGRHWLSPFVRQGHGEGCAGIGLEQFDAAAMRAQHCTNDGKPHPGAATFPACGEKTFENPRPIIWRYACTIVAQDQAQHAFLLIGMKIEPGGAVLDRVISQM